MDLDFSQQVVRSPSNAGQQYFGLIVPGGPVRTDFTPVDNTGLKYSLRLECPGNMPLPLTSVTELVFFLLPNVPLPPDHGVMCYWQMEAAATSLLASQCPQQATVTTGFELLGAITPNQPSVVFHTGWSEHEQAIEVSSRNTPVTITIGVSLEPLSNIQNMGALRADSRLFVAQKVAADLFKFMGSFDTGAAGGNQMVVPKNIFDRWFQRFENRFRRDPNFFLKQADDS